MDAPSVSAFPKALLQEKQGKWGPELSFRRYGCGRINGAAIAADGGYYLDNWTRNSDPEV
jgi:hypothetical protein